MDLGAIGSSGRDASLIDVSIFDESVNTFVIASGRPCDRMLLGDPCGDDAPGSASAPPLSGSDSDVIAGVGAGSLPMLLAEGVLGAGADSGAGALAPGRSSLLSTRRDGELGELPPL